jgi:chitosanase
LECVYIRVAGAPARSPPDANSNAKGYSMSLADADLARRIKAISSVFEVGSPEPDYGYVENLDDGRGYTVTQYGFCTYNEEVAHVIEAIAKRAPDTPLKRFLPHLPPQNWDGHKLDEFPRLWRQEAKASSALAEACDEVANELYLSPAIDAAASVGITSPVGIAIFFDTLVQHGDGDDPDALPAIMKSVNARAPEADYLSAFLDARKKVLLHSADKETREVWRESAGRVDALRTLLKENPNLAAPLKVGDGEGETIAIA